MILEKETYIKSIFATSILLTRKWEVIVNRAHPEGDLTLKQLMVLIVLSSFSDEDPTIKQVSTKLVTSHQNVKAILLQLEKKGFVKLYKDLNDKRIQRIQVCDGKEDYWKDRDEIDNQLFEQFFHGIELKDLMTTCSVIEKLNQIAGKNLEF